MKTYYLTAETDRQTGKIRISLHDSPKIGTVIFKVEAESFAEATKRLSFSVEYCGKSGYLTVAQNRIVSEVL